MEKISASKLLAGLVPADFIREEVQVELVTTDSREVRPGCIFVAFPGEKFDHRAVMRQQDTWLMWITLCALTAAVVVLGMFPGLLEPAVQAVTGPLFGGAA